ncbi:MAG: metal dependent phosphohydrolase [Candidatus Bathyarchaeota archaeon B23]|nr:MAG: metal dependent phosphohydrolase [Candidatus Bathyarchaeota archaeon B23]
MNLEGLLRLLRAAGRLKRTLRRGWVRAGVPHPESVAEHSYRAALLAMLLADLEGVDCERALRMALLHDLPESEVGDLTPEEKRRLGEDHLRGEEEAMQLLLSGLPRPLAEEYLDLWREYRRRESPEAVIVHQADRLEMILQALEYEEGGVAAGRLDPFWGWEGEGVASRLYDLLRGKREARST